MLGNFELSTAIVGAIVIQIAAYVILRIVRGSKRPKGSISEDKNQDPAPNRVTGNPILWLIAVIGLIIYFSTGLRLIVYCLSNSWESSNLYKQAFVFPIWVNYIGIVLLWFSGLLKGTIWAFNINLTPFFSPMKKGYTLATGGPYRFVRHPLYTVYFLATISLFMITGIKWFMLSFLFLLACIPQAYSEETVLRKIFGKYYENYASKTGMFIPKLFKFQRTS